jgi:hypothetical protein
VKPKKNPHAVALGRLGGSVGSPAQKAAARRNGLNSPGPARKYPIVLTGAERMHLHNIREYEGGRPRTPAQIAVVARLNAAKESAS